MFRSKHPERNAVGRPPLRMTPEELAILKALADGKSVEQVSRITKLRPEFVGRAVAKLQVEGMIADDGTLTEKGASASKNE